MGEPEGIGLDEALEILRSELASAREKAAGKPVQFPIESLTVELKVGVTRSVDGKAGFKVPFIGAELGASGGRASESVQTVTVVLGPPIDEGGQPIRVSSASDQQKD